MIGDLFGAYYLDRQRDGKQVEPIKHNWIALAPWFDRLRPEDVTTDLCRSYAQHRFDQGRASATVWTELTRLRTALQWAKKRELIEKVPHIWAPAKGQPRQRVLTVDEFRALLAECREPHLRLFVILALTTGHRSGAILELRWSKVDFVAGTIDLRSDAPVDPMSHGYQKGRSVVPMVPLAASALQDAKGMARTPYVVEYAGRPVKSVKKAFKSAARRAKLFDVSPHTLRHTAATRLVEHVTMEEAARFIGHKDPRTTRQIYAKPEAETLRDAAGALDIKVVK